MKQLLNKRNLLLAALVLLTIGLAVIGYVGRQNRPGRTITTVDRDTGEHLIFEPNKDPEQFNNASDILVLGSPELLRRGLTEKQFSLFREQVVAYVVRNFQGYDRVKILPASLVGSGSTIKGDLRLGESDNILEFEIKAHDLRFLQLTLRDPTNQVAELKTAELEAPAETEEHEHDVP